MEWTIKTYYPERKFSDGSTRPEFTKEYTIPFKSGDAVYYVHEEARFAQKHEWVISVCVVTGAWATDLCGVILDCDTYVSEYEFDQLFTDRDAALDFCVKKNAHAKVKIYGE